MGFQQLLLDTEAIKKSLMDLPKHSKTFQGPTDTLPVGFHAYRSFVAREMGQVETLLKVAAAGPEQLIEMFKTLLPDKANSLYDFQKILELKSLRKADAQTLLL